MSGIHVSKHLPIISQAMNIFQYLSVFHKKKSCPSLGSFMSHYLTKKEIFFFPHWVPSCPTIWQKRNLFFSRIGFLHVPLFDKKEIFFFPALGSCPTIWSKKKSFFSPHWVHVPLFDKKRNLFFPSLGSCPPPPPFHV
jgi:hypothetical protein